VTERPNAIMKEPVYEVFARKTREEALRHIGCVNALNGALARVCAWKTYDEQNWFEMCVVPRSAILPVNLREGPFADRVPESLGEVIRTRGAASYGGDEIVADDGETP
jgi:1,2-phenylacetyl-CoA epoxidase PaaB subunit